MLVDIVEAQGQQFRLTVRKDSATIKLAQNVDVSLREKAIAFFLEIAEKHKGTPHTLRGSTNKFQLGIKLMNDARTQCYHYEGTLAA
jgi:hypothetical protein